MLRLPADDEQISVFLGAGFVVTIQEREGDCFDPVRERVRDGRGRIRGCGSDYLAYALIDSAIDSHFPLLEQIGDQLEDLEDEIIGGRGSDAPRKIQSIRGRLRNMGRTHYPHSDVVRTLLHPETPYVAEETRPFLRDCLDHAVRVADQIDNYRDESSDLMHLHMASISNKMNEVMKVLTIMAAIFIPLSFIAGVYGMNFEADVPWNMPELQWKWGYPAVLGGMLAIALTLLAIFKRRGWF